MKNALIVREAQRFTKAFLSDKLPKDILFHNYAHALYMVNAATEIAAYTRVNEVELSILQIAAYFHDTGYCYSYAGHEEDSIAIAATFLKQQNCDNAFIDRVSQCIAATKKPQKPKDKLQEIICDAEMYHLADDNYFEISQQLRTEWQLKNIKVFSDKKWMEFNLNMLMKHRFFTGYGQKVLQLFKLKNIDMLLDNSKFLSGQH